MLLPLQETRPHSLLAMAFSPFNFTFAIQFSCSWNNKKRKKVRKNQHVNFKQGLFVKQESSSLGFAFGIRTKRVFVLNHAVFSYFLQITKSLVSLVHKKRKEICKHFLLQKQSQTANNANSHSAQGKTNKQQQNKAVGCLSNTVKQKNNVAQSCKPGCKQPQVQHK